MRGYIYNFLIGLDQFANSILGGAPDETISSRVGRARTNGHWMGKFMCWWLDWLDPGHCKDAIQSERDHQHLPKDLQH